MKFSLLQVKKKSNEPLSPFGSEWILLFLFFVAVRYFGEMIQELVKCFYANKTLYYSSELWYFTCMVLNQCYSFCNIILMFGSKIIKFDLLVYLIYEKWVIIYKINRVTPLIYSFRNKLSCLKIVPYLIVYESLK